MFVDCSGIIISITVKHEQHIGIIKAFVYLEGSLLNFWGPGGQKKLMGCGLVGGSAPRLTLWVNEKQKLWKEWKQGNTSKEQYLEAGLILENKGMRVV